MDATVAAGSPPINTFLEQLAGLIVPPWLVGSPPLAAGFDISNTLQS